MIKATAYLRPNLRFCIFIFCHCHGQFRGPGLRSDSEHLRSVFYFPSSGVQLLTPWLSCTPNSGCFHIFPHCHRQWRGPGPQSVSKPSRSVFLSPPGGGGMINATALLHPNLFSSFFIFPPLSRAVQGTWPAFRF